jgi:hypothetical protein
VLHDFLAANRAEIISRARSMVAARWAPQATTSELQDGIPLFLEQLIERCGRSMQMITRRWRPAPPSTAGSC